jgi:hypothetical protein
MIDYKKGADLISYHRKDHKDTVLHFDPQTQITTLMSSTRQYPFDVSFAVVNKIKLKPNDVVNKAIDNYAVHDDDSSNSSVIKSDLDMYFGGNKKFPIHLNTSEELEEG